LFGLWWNSDRDDFIGSVKIQLNNFLIPDPDKKGAMLGKKQSIFTAGKEGISIGSLENGLHIFGNHKRTSHGQLAFEIFYVEGDSVQAAEAKRLALELEEKMAELDQAEMKDTVAGAHMSSDLTKWQCNVAVPCREEFDVDSKQIGIVREQEILCEYDRRTDEQGFEHIKTEIHSQSGWVPIRNARNEVCLKKKQVHKLKRSKSVLGSLWSELTTPQMKLHEDKEYKSAAMVPPADVEYELRVHLYQARGLPAADDDGTSDPYAKISVAGMKKESKVCFDTCYPRWYQTLRFQKLMLPDASRVKLGLAPMMILQIFDWDEWSKHDFLGRFSVQLSQVSSNLMPRKPKWYNVQLYDTDLNAGQVLMSAQLLQLSQFNTGRSDGSDDPRLAIRNSLPPMPGSKAHVPPLLPKSRDCTLEFFILGCRGLTGVKFMDPKSPWVSIAMTGSGQARLETSKRNSPSAESPNYTEIINKHVYIPEEPDFAPVLTAFVQDLRFKGLFAKAAGNTILGTTTINLGPYLPWVEKNNERMKQRLASATSSNRQRMKAGITATIANLRMTKLKSLLVAGALEPAEDLHEPEPEGQLESEPGSQFEPVSRMSVEAGMERTSIAVPEGVVSELARDSVDDYGESSNLLNGSPQSDDSSTKSKSGSKTRRWKKVSRPDTVHESQTEPDDLENQRDEDDDENDEDEDEDEGDESDEQASIDFSVTDSQTPSFIQSNQGVDETPDWVKKRQVIIGDPAANPEPKTLPHELEKWLFSPEPQGHGATLPFDEWPLTRENELSKSQTRKKGKPSSAAKVKEFGRIKGFIRIIDRTNDADIESMDEGLLRKKCDEANLMHDANPTRIQMEDALKLHLTIPFPIDLASLLNPRPVVVRFYVISGRKLAARDKGNLSDPFCVVKLGDTVIDDKANKIEGSVNPYFGRCFEMNAMLPGPSLLTLDIYDWDRIGKNEIIGSTTIDLEDRFFSPAWQKLGQKYELPDNYGDKIREEQKEADKHHLAFISTIAHMTKSELKKFLKAREQELEEQRDAYRDEIKILEAQRDSAPCTESAQVDPKRETEGATGRTFVNKHAIWCDKSGGPSPERLDKMKLAQLRQQARGLGVPDDKIEQAESSDATNAALVKLVLGVHMEQTRGPRGEQRVDKEAVRHELQCLGQIQLRNRAEKMGVDAHLIATAEDRPDTKAAVAWLILEAHDETVRLESGVQSEKVASQLKELEDLMSKLSPKGRTLHTLREMVVSLVTEEKEEEDLKREKRGKHPTLVERIYRPIEHRTLRIGNSQMVQGQIECWVDILTKSQAASQPIIDISRPPKEEFELRICIYKTRNMAIMDPMTQMNDLYITGNLTTADENRKIHSRMLETDTHWRAPGGQGEFNWRWKYSVQLPVEDPCRLLIEAWDKDVIGSNDNIGSLQLNLNTFLLNRAIKKFRDHKVFMDRVAKLDEKDLRKELGEIMIKSKGMGTGIGGLVPLNIPETTFDEATQTDVPIGVSELRALLVSKSKLGSLNRTVVRWPRHVDPMAAARSTFMRMFDFSGNTAVRREHATGWLDPLTHPNAGARNILVVLSLITGRGQCALARLLSLVVN
jgi:hypothetical protein